MTNKVTIANPTTTPMVYSKDGHTIGAGERREDVALDTVGRAALDRGDLVLIEDGESKEDENLPGEAEVEPGPENKNAPARRNGK